MREAVDRQTQCMCNRFKTWNLLSSWYTYVVLANHTNLSIFLTKTDSGHFMVYFLLKALHLIDEMDLNSDKKLSEEEILENQDLFLTSEATDYGRQLHDDYFYHDEL
jgi:hypothetical protein